ncbi:MAG: hypothetical protein KGR26_11280 [Cyanobacteria bacterium REEB65]|nr:hypothetical protein [Cyanobacteria bacterium REEB65]
MTTYYRMADSVTPANLPPGFDAYLGYVDGRWPDYQAIAQAHGDKPCFGLSVIGNPAAKQAAGGDFEPGDAEIAQMPALVRGLHALGVARPIVYCPMSWSYSAMVALNNAGIYRTSYRLLTAHYGVGAHLCGPNTCGAFVSADGTQWIDHGPYDESLLVPSFLDLPMSVTPPEGPTMANLARPVIAVVMRPQGDGYWQIAQDGGIANFGAAPAFAANDQLPGLLAAGHLVTDATTTPTGNGLVLNGSDGGIFTFGDAAYHGSWSQSAAPSSAPIQA